MPIIQCDIREGRTEQQKRALAREITRVVHETIGAPVEYIYVLIRETPGLHHIKGGEHLPDFAAAPHKLRQTANKTPAE
jgi:4-oxalocrotonate tautomerase family enzyme